MAGLGHSTQGGRAPLTSLVFTSIVFSHNKTRNRKPPNDSSDEHHFAPLRLMEEPYAQT
jgi:hypothetical protein